MSVHAIVKVRVDGNLIETTPGRLMFNLILPKEVRNYGITFGKKELKNLIAELYKRYGFEKTSKLLDDIKEFGYHFGTLAGITVGIEDLKIPETKKEILENAEKSVAEVEKQYKAGEIINEERYRKTVGIWSEATEKVTKDMMDNLDEFNPVYMMANSGAMRVNLRKCVSLVECVDLWRIRKVESLKCRLKPTLGKVLTSWNSLCHHMEREKGLPIQH